MRFMVFVKLTNPTDYEAGQMPSLDEVATMMAFNEEIAKAGVLKSADGLYPTAHGAVVRFGEGTSTVTTGPFTETTELVGGYWIWEVASREEAVAWAQKCPMAPGDVLELRRIFDMEDFQVPEGSELQAQVERVAALEAQNR